MKLTRVYMSGECNCKLLLHQQIKIETTHTAVYKQKKVCSLTYHKLEWQQ